MKSKGGFDTIFVQGSGAGGRQKSLNHRHIRQWGKWISSFHVLLLIAAVLLIAAGAARGDMMMLFRRATFICMECVGIG